VAIEANGDAMRGCLDHDAVLRALSDPLVGVLHGSLKTPHPCDEATAWSHRLKLSGSA
jgi:hypothetical protein